MYLYILYIIGFLKFSDLIRLSWPVWEFSYRPPGWYVPHPSQSIRFAVSYSSLGETRLCSKECSIAKQRFSVILRHFLEHFWHLVMLFACYLLPVLAIRQQLKRAYLPVPCLLPEDYSRIVYLTELL